MHGFFLTMIIKKSRRTCNTTEHAWIFLYKKKTKPYLSLRRGDGDEDEAIRQNGEEIATTQKTNGTMMMG
jgi:hypothetical protein